MNNVYARNLTPFWSGIKSILLGIFISYLVLLLLIWLPLSLNKSHGLINEFAVYAIFVFATALASF